jgi:hypothetical protein
LSVIKIKGLDDLVSTVAVAQHICLIDSVQIMNIFLLFLYPLVRDCYTIGEIGKYVRDRFFNSLVVFFDTNRPRCGDEPVIDNESRHANHSLVDVEQRIGDQLGRPLGIFGGTEVSDRITKEGLEFGHDCGIDLFPFDPTPIHATQVRDRGFFWDIDTTSGKDRFEFG